MRRALDPPPRITRSKNRLRTIGQPAKQMLNGECVPRTAKLWPSCGRVERVTIAMFAEYRYVRRLDRSKGLIRSTGLVRGLCDYDFTWLIVILIRRENCTRYAKIYLFFVIDR